MRRKPFLLSALAGALATAAALTHAPSGTAAEPGTEIVPVADVTWEALNPARGDKSPRATTLWGDRKRLVPTGFLVQFVDGFSSPPHIHNVTYRGVVISGLVHNDDPGAEPMWMPPGSFWTQPKGEVHITAAKGKTNIAFIEIDEGPYLVRPPSDAFDKGERPINVDASNIVWVNAPGMPAAKNGPKIAYLWGIPQQDQPNGTFVRLPSGFAGKINSNATTFRAVVIKGRPRHRSPGDGDGKTLAPGSYFGSKSEPVHGLSCEGPQDCILYIRANGAYDVLPGKG